MLPPQARVCVTDTVAAQKPCIIDQCSGDDPWAPQRHALCCKKGGTPQAIHDVTVERLAALCAQLGFGVEEPAATGWLPGHCRKRVDLAIRGAGTMGCTLIVDVTRRHIEPGADALRTLERADQGKYDKYAKLLFRQATLLAFSFNHRGRLSPAAKRIVQLIAEAAARRNDAHMDDVRAALLRRFAVSLYHATAFACARIADAAQCAHLPGVPLLEDLRVRGRLARTLPVSRRALLHADSPPSRCSTATPWL